MTIQFETISSSRRTPGIETEINTRGASRAAPSTRPRVMLVGQRMGSVISTPSFVPSSSPGLNDCVLGTTPAAPTFTGAALRKFLVEITATGTPDIFKWSADNGSTWTTGVSVSTSDIALQEGVDIRFGATTGHAVGDRWTFFAFPAGSVAEKTPTQVSSDGDMAAYCGRGSFLHRAFKALKATAEKYGVVEVNFTSVNDAAGTAASGAIEITGTATAAGYLRFSYGNDSFQVSYGSGATAASIALSLKALLDTDQGLDLDVVCHRLAGTLNKIILTSKHAGTVGNEKLLACEATADTGITATLTQMTGGLTDPTEQNFNATLDAFQSTRYHIIACLLPDATSLAALKAHLIVVSNASNRKYAIGVYGENTATLATATALARGVNSERVQCIYVKSSRSAKYEIAGAYCALRAFVEDPAGQLDDLLLYGIHVPGVAVRISDDDIETCLWNGVTPVRVNSYELLSVVRAITTNITADYYVDISTVLTLDYLRTAVVARFGNVFSYPNNKYSADKNGALVDEAFFVAKQLESEPNGGCLRNVDAHKAKFVAEADHVDPTRANVAIPAEVVPGLHRICARIDLIWG